MSDFIVAGIIVLIVAAALLYIYKEKKKGVKCVGCPFAETCASKNNHTKCNCK